MEVKDKPLVSVIIPTYKRPGMLGRAIQSVLNQTYENIEVIVIDDNDEESVYRKETEEFMKQYIKNINVVYLKHKINKNGAAARNTGINYTDAKYVAFLDDDDEFHPRKIELQVNALENLDESWGGIYCGFFQQHRDKIVYKSKNLKYGNLNKELLLLESSICAGSTLLIRNKILKELNGFDESFIRHQDWELLLRFFRRYKLAVLDEHLAVIHLDSMINRPNAFLLEEVKKKYLNCFKKDIGKFDIGIQKRIYKRQYFHLAKAFLVKRNFKKGFKYIKISNQNEKILLKEKLYLLFFLLDSFIPFIDKMRMIRSKQI
jgi:glycosyltransferase involved in cell wall biosynthesis